MLRNAHKANQKMTKSKGARHTKQGLTFNYYKPSPSCQTPELGNLYSISLGERKKGFFVEVGAFDGITWSNSSCLAEAGWQGILVEPIPELASRCREKYLNNPKVKVLECAVGAQEGKAELHVADQFTTMNTGMFKAYKSIDWASPNTINSRRIKVEMQSLDAVLDLEKQKSRLRRGLDVLIIDVEGAEKEVLQGLSIHKWKPRLIIAELVHTHPDLHLISRGDADIQRKIERQGYSVVYKDMINTVLARIERQPSTQSRLIARLYQALKLTR